MSKTYIIGYDLNSPGQKYERLFEQIKKLSGGNWWHHLDSTWVIKYVGSASDLRNALQPYIDTNDELLVAALTGEAAWVGFNKEGSNWLKNNL